MTPDALIRVLPAEFNGASPQADASTEEPDGELSPPDSDEVSAPGPELREWEAKARKNGYGNLRYKGFEVRCEWLRPPKGCRG